MESQERETQSKIEATEMNGADEIPIGFFSKRSNKTTKLINNADNQNHLSGQNKWFEFNLSEDIFALSIEVHTTGYDRSDSMEMISINSTGLESKTKKEFPENGVYKFGINEFVGSISFKPCRAYFVSPTITSVIVRGYTRQDFLLLTDQIADVEGYKRNILSSTNEAIEEANNCRQEISEFQSKKEDIENEIKEVTQNRDAINEDITELRDQKSDLQSEISALKSVESDTVKRTESLDDSIDGKKNEQRKLNQEIADNNSELKKLKDNINLFPSEIAEFAKEGAENVNRYAMFLLIPLIILALCTWLLLTDAVDLTSIYKEDPDFSYWSILVTRLPFVLVSVTLIHASYKVARMFILEIMRINSQRLNLSTISIIATDVATASCDGLEIDSDQLFEHRTKLKLELLREHLKEYISDKYSYEISSSKLEKNKPEQVKDAEETEEAEV